MNDSNGNQSLLMIVVFGIIAWATGILGPDARARSLAKARRAKKRKARMRRGSSRRKRTGRKLSKTDLRALRLRNLAKARRAKKRKAK